MYAAIRRYNAYQGSVTELVRRVTEEFVPLISQQPGFVAYYGVDPGDGSILTVSLFEDKAGADQSTRVAHDYVRQHLTHMIKTAPVIVTGEVVMHKAAEREVRA
jgi:hypothetical protein